MDTSFSLSTDYCRELRREFLQALEKQPVSVIDYQYHKLLHACEVAVEDMDAVNEVFNELGYRIEWQENNTYQFTDFPDSLINRDIYWGDVSFDGLPPSDPIKNRFETLGQLLQAADIDPAQSVGEHLFLPHYQAFWVAQIDGGVLLDTSTLKPLLDLKSQKAEVDYAGAGLFLIRQGNRCMAYQLSKGPGENRLRKILDQPGFTINAFPVYSDTNYIAVTRSESNSRKTTLFNNHGARLCDNLDLLHFNPRSRTIVTKKDGTYELHDYSLNLILKEAQYLFELWKDDTPYYLYDAQDGTRHLYNREGNLILSGYDYAEIKIDRGPYAIVKKNGKFGVIDFVTNAICMPFQNEPILQLYPGFLTYYKDSSWTIIDEKKRVIGSLFAQQIKPMTSLGKGLVKAIDLYGKEGIYDLFGNELIPTIYDAIELNELHNEFLITSGQTQFKTDLFGNKIEY